MNPTTLVVSYTLKCNIACAHCCVDAGPSRRDSFPHRKFLPLLNDFHARGIREMEMTGGEITLCLDTAGTLMRKATSLGWLVGIVSNGWWGKSSRGARDMAARLRDNGVRRVQLSTGRFHQKFIPASSVVRAVDQLKKYGIDTVLTYLADRASTPADHKEMRALGKLSFLAYYSLMPLGRARLLPERVMAYDKTWDNVVSARCCAAGAVVVRSSGKLYSCVFAPDFPDSSLFFLGNVLREPMQRIWARYRSTEAVLGLLAAKGPAGVYRRCEKQLKAAGFMKDSLFYHPCEFCCDMFNSPKGMGIIRRQLCSPARAGARGGRQ